MLWPRTTKKKQNSYILHEFAERFLSYEPSTFIVIQISLFIHDHEILPNPDLFDDFTTILRLGKVLMNLSFDMVYSVTALAHMKASNYKQNRIHT